MGDLRQMTKECLFFSSRALKFFCEVNFWGVVFFSAFLTLSIMKMHSLRELGFFFDQHSVRRPSLKKMNRFLLKLVLCDALSC